LSGQRRRRRKDALRRKQWRSQPLLHFEEFLFQHFVIDEIGAGIYRKEFDAVFLKQAVNFCLSAS
jgi:hypothetical protein